MVLNRCATRMLVHPGEAQELPLPRGEGGSAFGHDLVVAAGQPLDELPSLDLLGGPAQALLRDGSAESDVFLHRSAEDDRFLQHDGDFFPQG
jgi:hypothetical protein